MDANASMPFVMAPWMHATGKYVDAIVGGMRLTLKLVAGRVHAAATGSSHCGCTLFRLMISYHHQFSQLASEKQTVIAPLGAGQHADNDGTMTASQIGDDDNTIGVSWLG